MTDPTLRGRRTVVRVVVWQAASAMAAAVCFGVFSGRWAALSALAGGLIIAIGTALFGWRMFAPGIASAAVVKRAMMAGEAIKWLWLILAMWLGLTQLMFAPLPLLVGLIVAQFGYWFGLVSRNKG